MFGGMPLKNTQVESGGVARHVAANGCGESRRGRRVRQRQPWSRTTPPISSAPSGWRPRPNTDTALMLGLAHTLVAEGLHDRAFLARYCVGLRAVPRATSWARPTASRRMRTGRRGSPRCRPRRSAISRGAWRPTRTHGHGELVAAARRPRRAAVSGWRSRWPRCSGQIGLPGGGFGFGYGSMNAMGSPRRWHPSAGAAAGDEPDRQLHSGGAHRRHAAQPGRPRFYDGQTRTYPRHPPRLLVRRQSVPPPSGPQPAAARRGASPRRSSCTSRGGRRWPGIADIVLPATTTLERNDIGASSARPLHARDEARRSTPVGEARERPRHLRRARRTRLAFARAFTEGRDEMEWLRHLYDVSRAAGGAGQGRAAGFRRVLGDRATSKCRSREAPIVLLEDFRRDPAQHPLDDAVGPDRDLFRAHRRVRLRRLPGPSGLARAGEWLGSESATRVSAASHLEPAAHPAAQPARPRRA